MRLQKSLKYAKKSKNTAPPWELKTRFGPQNAEIGSDHQTKHIVDIVQTGLKC